MSKRSTVVKRDLSSQAMFNKEHAWWVVLIKGKRGNPKRQGKQSRRQSMSGSHNIL